MKHRGHGVVVICQRQHNGMVAWVEEEMSKDIPAGYFIEVRVRAVGNHDTVWVGTLRGGYISECLSYQVACDWCQHEQRRRKRDRERSMAA